MLLPLEVGAPAARPIVVGGDGWRGSGLVLVVDDEAPVRRIAARMVEALGFEVFAAASGEEALAKFDALGGEVVAVLLDLTMPGMDGVRTFEALRARRADVQVLLMSGYSEEDAVNRFTSGGLAGFVAKPFRLDDLRVRLQGLVEAPRPPR